MSKFGLGILVKLKDPVKSGFLPNDLYDPSIPMIGVVKWKNGVSCFVSFPNTGSEFVDENQLEVLSEREMKEFLIRYVMKD